MTAKGIFDGVPDDELRTMVANRALQKEGWYEVTAENAWRYLDMIRLLYAELVGRWRHRADPQLLTALELAACAQGGNHRCWIFFEEGEPIGMVSGELMTMPDGTPAFHIGWILVPNHVEELRHLLRSKGCQKFLVASEHSRKALERWWGSEIRVHMTTYEGDL